MIVLIDTDIILDIALDRRPFYDHSAKMIQLAEACALESNISWHSVSNIYYLMKKWADHEKAIKYIREILSCMDIPMVSRKEVQYAFMIDMPDFEDALQVATARACQAEWIITRNVKHFKHSPIQAIAPKAFLNRFFMENS